MVLFRNDALLLQAAEEANVCLHPILEKNQNVDSDQRYTTSRSVISLCFFFLFQEGEGNCKDVLAEKTSA